jgi:hypothetical protein
MFVWLSFEVSRCVSLGGVLPPRKRFVAADSVASGNRKAMKPFPSTMVACDVTVIRCSPVCRWCTAAAHWADSVDPPPSRTLTLRRRGLSHLE